MHSMIDALLKRWESAGTLGFYDICSVVFASWAAVSPLLLFIEAGHGRASPADKASGSRFMNLCVNGNLGWLLMEIVSPITFVWSLSGDVLSDNATSANWGKLTSLSTQQIILASAFLIHYVNRSIVSTLRNPGRAPMHISVPVAAILFNLLNGWLMGVWVGERIPGQTSQVDRLPFTLAMIAWLFGFVGNVVHDEILYNLRKDAATTSDKRKYYLPHGGLYSSPFGGVSAPAYLCEWFEWFAFAIAAGAFCRPQGFLPSPPLLFFANEVALMLPRAIQTHRWYQEKFRDTLPANRRAIIPGLL